MSTASCPATSAVTWCAQCLWKGTPATVTASTSLQRCLLMVVYVQQLASTPNSVSTVATICAWEYDLRSGSSSQVTAPHARECTMLCLSVLWLHFLESPGCVSISTLVLIQLVALLMNIAVSVITSTRHIAQVLQFSCLFVQSLISLLLSSQRCGAGAIQLMVALFMMLFVVGSSFRTRKSSNQAGPQDLMLLFRAPDYSL